MIKVSILIPTYNRANNLKTAIQSALSQNYENLEVIVSDNNSSDNTSEIISEFIEDSRFKYYKNSKNIGMVNNFKKLVFDYCSGDFFILLSDDDYLIKNDYINKAIKLINSHENILLVYSNGYMFYEEINKKHEIVPPFNNFEIGKDIFMKYLKVKNINSFLPNILFNREFTIKLNSFSNEYNLACDMELFLKSCLCGNVGIIKDFTSVYTYHPQNLSESLHEHYEFIINTVDHVLNPYLLALKENKLSNDEKLQWETQVIFNVFRSSLAHVLFYFPEKYENAVEFLSIKDEYLLNEVLNSKLFRVMLFTNKIKVYNFLYRIQRFMTFFRHKYQI